MQTLLRALIHWFDGALSRALGIYVFCEEPDCILRLQRSRAAHPLSFSTHIVPRGEPVLVLHLWNERLPPFSLTGPDLFWANRILHLFIRSLRRVAQHTQLDPRLSQVRAVGGVTALLLQDAPSGGVSLIERLGFTVMLYHNPLGKFGVFWENLYSWWLMWTYNPLTLRGRRLLDLQRLEIWMPVEVFLGRYAPEKGEAT